VTARFTPCFLPFIAAIPAIIGALILLAYVLKLFSQYRPQWTKTFIKEAKESQGDLPATGAYQPWSAMYGLLLVSFIGLTLQLVTIFFPFRQLIAMYPLIAWVCYLHHYK
jgi:hypothetical protein